MEKKEENLHLLRRIDEKPHSSQREFANELGLSLGKVNYCLNELRKKGLIKIKNFKKNPNKANYIYILTPKGITEKTKLTINIIKKKLSKYDQLKSK